MKYHPRTPVFLNQFIDVSFVVKGCSDQNANMNIYHLDYIHSSCQHLVVSIYNTGKKIKQAWSESLDFLT